MTAKERFNLAILAVGNNDNFSVTQFVSLHQKEIESSPHFYKDQDKDHDEQQVILPSMPADSQESVSTETASVHKQMPICQMLSYQLTK